MIFCFCGHFLFLIFVSLSASVKVKVLGKLFYNDVNSCVDLQDYSQNELISKVFSFEKNSPGKNPPGPLSFTTLDSKTVEELPSRFGFHVPYK